MQWEREKKKPHVELKLKTYRAFATSDHHKLCDWIFIGAHKCPLKMAIAIQPARIDFRGNEQRFCDSQMCHMVYFVCKLETSAFWETSEAKIPSGVWFLVAQCCFISFVVAHIFGSEWRKKTIAFFTWFIHQNAAEIWPMTIFLFLVFFTWNLFSLWFWSSTALKTFYITQKNIVITWLWRLLHRREIRC